MNKIIQLTFSMSLFLLSALSPLSTKAQSVDIKDIKLRMALITNKQINTNGDYVIQITEAENFTGFLDISNSEIRDLQGLEYFTSIKGLNCSNNKLTAISLDSHKKLTQLNCSDNQIKTLDITMLKELRDLNFEDNQIKTINLKNNNLLTRFVCQNNRLTVLDLKNKGELTKLDCSNNSIAYLNLNKNKKLNTLDCSGNNMQGLNMANGNNENISAGSFNALNNKLNCIMVDNTVYSEQNWINLIDNISYYSNKCNVIPENTPTESKLVL